jgi:pyruvate ferredoxin oxidoreductase alpha subunit
VDAAREDGHALGAVSIKSFRPFPLEELGRMLAGARRVIVLERAFAVGVGGIVSADVRSALAGSAAEIHTVIAGLGGRAITRASLRAMLDDARAGRLEQLRFLDLRVDVVERELSRGRDGTRPGPHAENIIRDLGLVAGGPV